MKFTLIKLVVACAALLWAFAVAAEDAPRIGYVRPLVGTDGFGNVYPGAQVPFGGIQISPDTDDDYYDAASGYKYAHKTLMGFSLNHLSGTGIPDLGDFLFMPGVGEIKLEPGTHDDPDAGYRSRYSHDEEWCSPAYYGVNLTDYGVKAEMTAAQRSGILRFTYPEADDAFILVDMRCGGNAGGPTCARRMTTPSRAINSCRAGAPSAMFISWPSFPSRSTTSASWRAANGCATTRNVSAAIARRGAKT